MLTGDPFFQELKAIAARQLPNERLAKKRAYVNNTVYGDMYYTHRDVPPEMKDITILYYVNPVWHPEWGAETIYYGDDGDAQAAISVKPGRVLVSRGAILHRGGVPTRICNEERRTIAYKLSSE